LIERYQQKKLKLRNQTSQDPFATEADRWKEANGRVKAPKAANPERGGKQTIPIYNMCGVDEAGVKAKDSRYIGIDVDAGWRGALPCRFVLDTGAAHSVIKLAVAKDLSGKDVGAPVWAPPQAAQEQGMRQYNMGRCWMGKLDCGEFELCGMPGNLMIPIGACGILGLDFFRLFDWDFDFGKMQADVETARKDRPMSFDLTGMRAVPLMTVRAPKSFPVLAAPSKLRPPGLTEVDSAAIKAMSIMDLGAAFTVCNQAAVEALGFKMEDLAPMGEDMGSEFVGKVLVDLAIGSGPDGPLEVEAITVVVGNEEVFDGLNMGTIEPLLVVGMDVLGKSRLVLSTRLSCLWVPV